MKEDGKIPNTNKQISGKEKVHSESNVFENSASKANSLINEEFYHENRHQAGISPALLLVNAPLVDTDDQYINKNKER